MNQEAAVRTDPALRSERFVSDWQGLSTARKQLEQQGACAGAASVSAKQNELAKTLERDPQVEGLLRGKTRELGIDQKPERSIDKDRKSVVKGKSVSGRVDSGSRRNMQKKHTDKK